MVLTILSARYGIYGTWTDVTETVRALVNKKGLKIPRVTNEVLKTGPVLPGYRKHLIVEYKRDGVKASTRALERKSLLIR